VDPESRTSPQERKKRAAWGAEARDRRNKYKVSSARRVRRRRYFKLSKDRNGYSGRTIGGKGESRRRKEALFRRKAAEKKIHARKSRRKRTRRVAERLLLTALKRRKSKETYLFRESASEVLRAKQTEREKKKEPFGGVSHQKEKYPSGTGMKRKRGGSLSNNVTGKKKEF